MKCVECGKEFNPGTRPDGLPTGIGLQLADGTVIDICSDCIMQMTPEKARELARRCEE